MMFIIADKDPVKAVEYLVTHTDKRFYFKQLTELSQLICSTGISKQMKAINRGKEIQAWIISHSKYTVHYYKALLDYCEKTIKMSLDTRLKYTIILNDLLIYSLNTLNYKVENAVWRYAEGYQSKYPTNSRLDISTVCKEYRNYIENHKFKGYTINKEIINV